MIRKVRFGIRLKLSLAMIGGIMLVVVLVLGAVFSQYEESLEDRMGRVGEAVLNGAAFDLSRYLQWRQNYIHALQKGGYNGVQLQNMNKAYRTYLDNVKDYYSTVIPKDSLLDIAFVIDVNWKDVEFDPDKKLAVQYQYFDRSTGTPFVHNNKGERDYSLMWKFGHYDDFLEVPVYREFMNRIVLKPLTAKSMGHIKEGPDFVIVASPLFEDHYTTRALYRRYEKIQAQRGGNEEERNKRNQELNRFEKIFLTRAINKLVPVDYSLAIDTDAKKNAAYNYFVSRYDIRKLKADERRQLFEDYGKSFGEKLDDGTILRSDIETIFGELLVKYAPPLRNKKTKDLFWRDFYRYITWNRVGISVEPVKKLDELALVSYRADLVGISGLYLYRQEFAADMAENKKELVNLVISILLRAIILALFVPGFIVNAVTRLAEGARRIGEGDLTTRIDMKGSDELGRLGDIFNSMAENLQDAQAQMLIKQRMEDELKNAQQIQEALLPEELPTGKNLSVASHYTPQSESGGDYYDMIPLDDDRFAVIMADVSGHGVGSGLVMAMSRTLVHTFCRSVEDPRELALIVNGYLKDNTASNYFITMIYGIFNQKDGSFKYVSAGHNPAYVKKGSKLEELPAGGVALGAVGNEMASKMLKSHQVTLGKGTSLVLFTDGLVEAMNEAGEEFEEERFEESLKQSADEPQAIIDTSMAAVSRFTGDIPQHDDMTMLVITRA